MRCAGVTTPAALGVLMHTAYIAVPVRSSPCISSRLVTVLEAPLIRVKINRLKKNILSGGEADLFSQCFNDQI